jgi:hypothetical protein
VTENSDVIDEGSLVQLAFIQATVVNSTSALGDRFRTGRAKLGC